MQARRIARELALLGLSQLGTNPEKLETQQLQNVVIAAIRTLTTEAQETLETAVAELKRGSDRLLKSETQATDVKSAKAMVSDAIELTQTAINRVGIAVELPEFIQLANQQEVRAYSLEILTRVNSYRQAIDEKITNSMVDWQINRLPRIDRDILRIAVAEIIYLGIPNKVAINEAVELAKRYSGEEGHKFINGVLRRFNDSLKNE